MDEDFIKRITDCVYFLASPFTCKKGVECEYRHSEMARLNPRDCWYWLSGDCLNPSCAFRHPPLEVCSESSSGVAGSLLNDSGPATKTPVPCYFYFNGFWNKGDRCPFLHATDDYVAGKSKMANTIADAPLPPLDAKTSRRSAAETTLAKKHPNPNASEMAIKSHDGFQVQPKQEVLPPTSNNLLEQSPSPSVFAQEVDETDTVKMVTLQPAEALAKSDSEPSLCFDQSSQELVDGNIVQDEWWESSPGFNGLVEGKTEDMAYEYVPEYFHALDADDEDHEKLLMKHCYVDQNDIDERILSRNGIYNPSEHLDGEYRTDVSKYSPRHSLDRNFGRVALHKRKLLSLEFPGCSCSTVDLRDYLRKRRMIDGYLETIAVRHDVALGTNKRHQRIRKRTRNQQLQRRLSSKVEKNAGSSRKTAVVDVHRRGKSRNSRRNKSREYNAMKEHTLSAEGQRRSSSNRQTRSQVSVTFAGPKSLAEIKKQKKTGCSSRSESLDFNNPKPLSEILRDKKKITSTGEDNVNASS